MQINITLPPTAEDYKTWRETNPRSKMTDAIVDMECSVSYLEDGVRILAGLIEPLRDNILPIELTHIQVKALCGALSFLKMTHAELDEGIDDLYHALKDFKKP